MSYSVERRLLGVLIADHLANLSDRSNIISPLIHETSSIKKRRKKSDKSSSDIADDDDLAAMMLGRVTQTEHCLILYYRLLDMPGTIEACIELLDKNAKGIKLPFDSRIETAITQSNDPESSLFAALLISSSLIRDITANGIYVISELNSEGLQRTTSINSMDSNLSTYSYGSSTCIFKGIGFVEAIHEARELAMKDNSSNFDTLKNIIDRVGGRISNESTYIYRKILIRLIGLLQTSLIPSIKELLYESIGYLSVYINDIRDIDDTEIDTIDMFVRLVPQLAPKLLSYLPKTLESQILNCSTSARQGYSNYLIRSVNKVFNIFNERADWHCADLFSSVYAWLRFIYKNHKDISLDSNKSLFNKLIIYYLNNEDDLEFYMHEIMNYIGLIQPSIIDFLLNVNSIKGKINNFNVNSALKLFILLWNSSKTLGVLDLLNDLIDFNELQVVIPAIGRLEARVFTNVPKSHKVYSKIPQLIRLPSDIRDAIPFNFVISIFLMRKALYPLITSIVKVYSFKELKNVELKWNSPSNSSNSEVCLFLFAIKGTSKVDRSFKNNLYCFFALEDLTRIALSIDDMERALELSAYAGRMLKAWEGQFQPLEIISSEIISNIQIVINKAMLGLKGISSKIWNDIKDLDELSIYLLLGKLSSIDKSWSAISASISNEFINSLRGFIKSPSSSLDYLIISHRLLFICLGLNKIDFNIIELISKIISHGKLFINTSLFNQLFIIYNKCLRCEMKIDKNLISVVKTSWEKYIDHVIEFLDDGGIDVIDEVILAINEKVINENKPICDLPNMLNRLMIGYYELLERGIAHQLHGVALMKLIYRVIQMYCSESYFFTSELRHNIARVIFSCILLVREYPNTSYELSRCILLLLQALKTQSTKEGGDDFTFRLELEIGFKGDLLAERVGILKNLETGESDRVSLDHALLIFALQYYINHKGYIMNKFDNNLIEFIRPSYQLIRMMARELCNYGGTAEEQRKELSDFIDKYILPMFFNDGNVSRDFFKSLYEFSRIRKPKLEKSQPNLKLASVINGAKVKSKLNK